MPTILPGQLEGFGLDKSIEEPVAVLSVLTPYPNDTLEAYDVPTLVNSVANGDPDLIALVA